MAVIHFGHEVAGRVRRKSCALDFWISPADVIGSVNWKIPALVPMLFQGKI